MELKTQVHAEPGKQEITITRTFDLSVDLLFTAYTEAELVEQWMATKVLQLDNHAQGAYTFETTDPKGNIHRFAGCIHEFIPLTKITRTFKMETTPFPVQLEYLTFEELAENKSKLTMHVIYQSVAVRDQILQLPFVQGINMAHNRIEQLLKNQ